MFAAQNEKIRTRYVYNFDELGCAPDGACSAKVEMRGPAAGRVGANTQAASNVAVVTGSRCHVALMRRARGTGSKIHACANEQFQYVLQGTLIADIDGEVLRVPTAHVIHVPAGMPYGLAAGADDDAVFIVAMGVRPGVAGAARDGEARELDFFAACAADDDTWQVQPGGSREPRTTKVSGRTVRYVYAIDELEEMPEGVSSAKVTPKNYVSKKSSSLGAALSGETLHVGVIHKTRGSGAKLHTHPNEQFNLVLEGKLLGEIDGLPMEVLPRGLIHMPAGVQHCTMASADGDLTVFVVKDTSHGLAGPPVDGIEDGPRFLPGFGPQK
jgi:quercetin dioxygenase-like cupin family protein